MGDDLNSQMARMEARLEQLEAFREQVLSGNLELGRALKIRHPKNGQSIVIGPTPEAETMPDKGGIDISFYDAGGEDRLNIGLTRSGAAMVTMRDAKGKGRLTLTVSDDGHPTIMMFQPGSEEPIPVLAVSVRKDGTAGLDLIHLGEPNPIRRYP